MKLVLFWSLMLLTFNLMAETMVVNRPLAFLWRSPNYSAYNTYYDFERMDKSSAWSNTTNAIFSKWFIGKMESQLVFGEVVESIETLGDWTKVYAISQKTQKYTQGYEGWVLTSALSPFNDANAEKILITAKTAHIYFSTKLATILVKSIPYTSKLTVVEKLSSTFKVLLSDGRNGYIRKQDAVLENELIATGVKIVSEARRFINSRYLWAGTAPSGFDCSGLSYRVLNSLGVEIMRDAADQFSAGTKIETMQDVLPGDLVFFAKEGKIHHVGIYTGNNTMIHSPKTGEYVRSEKINTKTWSASFAGARRYF